ncbi:substrate-binding periplasmic protein [Kordiimonas pumila]|uniref:Substrate-binding periplasmic protein n=1 Tax=Kordiimonas pumila TaxID=2161677 RepID=A0ABV7D039_9PROT|nr:transporter substrate-binding domain-containing protein [Kordiimonas pumila]
MGKRWLLCIGLLGTAPTALGAEGYTIYQPDNPPWGSTETGDGFVVSIVLHAFKEAGIPYKSVFVPWKRAQAQVANSNNGFMAPLTRIESREDKYIWVAPVNISFLQLVTNNTEYASEKWQDLLEVPVIGRMESPAEYVLQDLGFKYLTIVEDERTAARLVLANRVSLWMQRGLPGNWAYFQAGGKMQDLHVIERWETPLQYLVASKSVPEITINRLRAVLDKMRISGEIDKIKQEYFPYEIDCELRFTCKEARSVE